VFIFSSFFSCTDSTSVINFSSIACIPDSHRSCETVIPLDSASKDVKKSSLLSDTLEEQDYRCHSAHSVHSFSSQSEQYFSATSLLFFSEHGLQIVSMMDLQVEIL
jgi:hypothetical protein